MPDPSDPPVHVLVGATGGIGSALARRLADQGARLVLAARDGKRLEALAEELSADAEQLDATDGPGVDALLADAKERHGRVDGAVNLVGSLLLKPAHRTSDEEWQETIAQNLTTAFNVVRGAVKVMQRQEGGGSIVLMASAVARIGMSNHEPIAAAKGGVLSLALAAASSYAHKAVRVNCVAPGMTETPMTAGLLGSDTSRKMSEKLHPMNTIAQPDEVASAIAWLLDPAQRVVTGQTLGVDAGLGTLQPRHTS